MMANYNLGQNNMEQSTSEISIFTSYESRIYCFIIHAKDSVPST